MIAAEPTFGQWLRAKREARGWSLADLSRRSGVAITTLWNAHNGSVPIVATARALGAALGADVEAMAAKHRKPRFPLPHGPWSEKQRSAIEGAFIEKARGRNRLTDARIALGWTGAELARRAGVRTSDVAALETGRETPRASAHFDDPWRENARKVADCLGESPERLWPEHAPHTPRLLRERPATPEEQYVAAETDEMVRRAVSSLSLRRQEVLSRRYGIGREAETMESIAECWGITKQRVQQLESEAIDELRLVISRITSDR